MSTAQPTLILISGLLCDAVVWQPTAYALSGAMPVVVTDLNQGDTFAEIAANILEANPGPLIVVGHSMGARVALEMIRQAPERIAKLGLVDTGVHALQQGEAEKRQVLIDLANDQGMAAVAAQWLPPMVHPDRVEDEVLMQALTKMVLRASPNIFARQVNAMLQRPEVEALLAQITCPVLLAVGRQDAWSPISQHEGMRDLIANGRLEIIEDAGHFAPLEQPAAMIVILQSWLNAEDGI